MTSNIDQFERDLKRLGQEKFVRQLTELYKAVVLTAFQYVTANSLTVGVAYGSPVLTGRFYGSHTLTIGSVDTRVKPENPKGSAAPYPGIPLSQAASIVARLKLDDIVYIANALPYARRIEFEGWSKFKAPNGVYRVAANLVRMKYKNVTVN